MRTSPPRLVLATLLASGHQIGEALVPVVVGFAIDEAIETGEGSGLAQTIGVLLLVFVGLSYSYRFYARTIVALIEQAAHDLRTTLARHILDPRAHEHGQLSGSLLRISSTDATEASEVLDTIPSLCAALAALVVTIVALFSVSTQLGLLVVIGSVPVLVLMHLLGRPLQKRVHADQEASAHVAGVAADLVRGLRVVKGLGIEPAARNRYRQVSATSLRATLRSAFFEAGFMGVSVLVTGLFLAVVALVAGRQAAQGTISVGALISAVGLAQFLIGPLERIVSMSVVLAHSRASADRVASVLASAPRVSGSRNVDAEQVTGAIAFTDVVSGSLSGVSFSVEAGEMLGIAALDGADGRAVLGCLARDVDPESGDVTLDGDSLRDAEPDSVRAAILVAAHDADLFDASLADNVAARAYDDRSTSAAVVAAAVDEVAESLADGVATTIGEKGQSLSGGQRQRVALARALATRAPVLVLHDPTSAVDTVTEARIAAGLRGTRVGLTTVVVATSPTLLAACDRVVVICAGTAIGEGTHAELVESNPAYRDAVLT